MRAENRETQTSSASQPGKKRKWLECDPASPVREVARVALEGRLESVPSLLETVVEEGRDVPDQVRLLRVATRRASTAVNLFSEFASPAATSQITRDLKKIRKVAGRMRDLDVLIANTEWKNPESENLQFLASRRSRAQLKLEKSYQKFIASGRLVENVRQLLESLQTNGSGGTPTLFETWAKANLNEAGKSFFAAWPTTASEQVDNFVVLHNFRLQVKKLRYQIELLASATRKKHRKKLNRQLKKMQNSLGEVNDRDIAIQKIHRWMRNAATKRQDELKQQLRHELTARTAAAQSFHELWPTTTRDEVRVLFDRMLVTSKSDGDSGTR